MSISKVVLEYWSQEGQVMARVIDEKGYWVHVGASTLKDSNPTVEDAVKILFNKKKIWNYSEEKAILTKFFCNCCDNRIPNHFCRQNFF